MTIEEYKYWLDYKTELDKFYNKSMYLLTLTQKCKICDELKRIEKLLNNEI